MLRRLCAYARPTACPVLTSGDVSGPDTPYVPTQDSVIILRDVVLCPYARWHRLLWRRMDDSARDTHVTPTHVHRRAGRGWQWWQRS
eukprot:1138761-Rhodomonas_salina.1